MQSIRDLGVVIDKSLSFTEHYSGVIIRASKMLGYIKRTAVNFSNSRALAILSTALVRPHLEYASPVWSPGARMHVNRGGDSVAPVPAVRSVQTGHGNEFIRSRLHKHNN